MLNLLVDRSRARWLQNAVRSEPADLDDYELSRREPRASPSMMRKALAALKNEWPLHNIATSVATLEEMHGNGVSLANTS